MALIIALPAVSATDLVIAKRPVSAQYSASASVNGFSTSHQGGVYVDAWNGQVACGGGGSTTGAGQYHYICH